MKAEARRILVRGVNWLGDAVMTTPALQRLRERFPDADIRLLTPEKLAELWLHHPSLDGILTFAPGESAWSAGRRLRTQAFDTALVLPNSPRSALEVWLGRVPRRIGYARPWRNWLLSEPVAPRAGQVRMHKRSVREIQRLVREGSPKARPAPGPSGPPVHQIYEYLHLTGALGAETLPVAPRLEVSAAELDQAQKNLWSRLKEKGHPLVLEKPPVLLGLNPGAAYGPAKRWPAENFARAAGGISRRLGNCVWLAFGGAGDRELCEEIVRRSGIGMENLAGQTSLRELMAFLKLCRVLLTNDTGPMHVAAALGTPVVVPFGSTAPELTGPGLPGDPRHRLLQADAACAPCFRRVCPIDFRCMSGVGVERVVEAVVAGLSPGGLPSGGG